MAHWLDAFRRLCGTGAVLVLSLALAVGQIPLEGGHGPLSHSHGSAEHEHAASDRAHHHEPNSAGGIARHDHAGQLGGFAVDFCNSVLCAPTLAVLRATLSSPEFQGALLFPLARACTGPRPILLDCDPPIPRLSA